MEGLIFCIAIIGVLLIDYFINNRKQRTSKMILYIFAIGSIALYLVLSLIDSHVALSYSFKFLSVTIRYMCLLVPVMCSYVAYSRHSKIVDIVVYFSGLVYFLHICNYAFKLGLYVPFVITDIIYVYFIAIYLLILFDNAFMFINNKRELEVYILIINSLPLMGLMFGFQSHNQNIIIYGFILEMLFCWFYNNQQLLNYDALTSLYNRRLLEHGYIDKKLLAKKNNAVFLIDVDNFKNINDTYGHNYGDKVLKDVGAILKKSIRCTDIAIRYGGDEFLLIADIKEEKNIQDIIKKINANLDVYNNDNPFGIVITVSIGADIYNTNVDFNKFIESIDEKMYSNKEKKKKLLLEK